MSAGSARLTETPVKTSESYFWCVTQATPRRSRCSKRAAWACAETRQQADR